MSCTGIWCASDPDCPDDRCPGKARARMARDTEAVQEHLRETYAPLKPDSRDWIGVGLAAAVIVAVVAVLAAVVV